MMKKKLITIVMGMVFWAGLFGGRENRRRAESSKGTT